MAPPPVLLVEDDPDIVLALSDLLAEDGFDVRAAADGRSASAMLEAVPRPCVVLLDLHMPVMNGSELLDRISSRTDCTDFRVVLMSASPESARLQAHPLVRGYVRKPFSIAQIVKVMQAALRG
ncbi:MAG: response regulator [Myxococcaceae bacterium]